MTEWRFCSARVFRRCGRSWVVSATSASIWFWFGVSSTLSGLLSLFGTLTVSTCAARRRGPRQLRWSVLWHGAEGTIRGTGASPRSYTFSGAAFTLKSVECRLLRGTERQEEQSERLKRSKQQQHHSAVTLRWVLFRPVVTLPVSSTLRSGFLGRSLFRKFKETFPAG